MPVASDGSVCWESVLQLGGFPQQPTWQQHFQSPPLELPYSAWSATWSGQCWTTSNISITNSITVMRHTTTVAILHTFRLHYDCNIQHASDLLSRVPAMEGRLFSQQIPQAVLTRTRKWTFCLVNYPVNFFSIQMKTLSIQPAVKICISISQNYTVKKSWCYILIPAVAWKISVVNYSIHLLILCILCL